MPDEPSEDLHSFQVDLRGLVDLLSQHLYSSPRVYIRELLQNAVDAVTARAKLEPDAPRSIRILVHEGGLRITDPGIGLTEPDAHRFLSTIGRSSKRDELAGARQEFLGQFGIGLLACFTVAESIRVVTRSAAAPDAPTIQWLATSDGTYSVERVAAGQELAEPGTRVELTPRAGAERWFVPERVVELAREYGALLPYEVTVEHEGRVVRTTDSPPMWDRAYPSPVARRMALMDYGESVLGFAPLDLVEFDLPLVGIRGVGYVLPQPANPTESGRHRIHLKGMLLGDAVAGLLPDWAFFLRCLVTADALKPTASREALYEDETLAAVREALGGRIRDWLTELAVQEPARLHAFLSVHAVGVKALACHDAGLLRIMLPYLEFETTDGRVPLTEFAKAHKEILVAASVEEFRQVAAIAAAQGVGVANGGYTYDSELLFQLPELLPGVAVEQLAADSITDALDPVDPVEELRLAGFLTAARATLEPLDCDVILREFQPYSVSALHVEGRAARQERTRAEAEAESEGLWAELLGALKSTQPRARLVLNHRNPVIRKLAQIPDPVLLGTAVEALYGQALLMTHRPLRPADTALLNRAFGELLGWATQVARPATDGQEAA
ncbi:HSP90 family protein [Actinospica durhamensis]|uniref:HSP90 family protein n=1 Tax=Actinospica durhamensis TaxID=1508375 RepID=A0A941EUL7_9ACTN|nr:HSP90 family protein [Actinospica durhamensis]MBR7836692.1 HSP90 family protein [Actinospica durhamensis]